MAQLNINNINFDINKQNILKDINLNIDNGEIFYLLGPSGCGKTTLLNLIAGLSKPNNGTIKLNNKIISSKSSLTPPEERDIAMVFQDFALFPNMTVKQNINFAIHKLSNTTKKQKLKYVLEMMEIATIQTKYPHELSGGQQQRVALARALASKPKIILFDEVFSSLDENFKYKLSFDIRKILKQEQITSIFVTHDQKEALGMADRIAIMHQQTIAQVDTSFNIYHKPNSQFVANFIGDGFFIDATIIDDNTVSTELGILKGDIKLQTLNINTNDKTFSLLIRPDNILHDDNSNHKIMVVEKFFQGSQIIFTLELHSGVKIQCIASGHHNHSVGKSIGVRLEIKDIILFQKKSN